MEKSVCNMRHSHDKPPCASSVGRAQSSDRGNLAANILAPRPNVQTQTYASSALQLVASATTNPNFAHTTCHAAGSSFRLVGRRPQRSRTTHLSFRPKRADAFSSRSLPRTRRLAQGGISLRFMGCGFTHDKTDFAAIPAAPPALWVVVSTTTNRIAQRKGLQPLKVPRHGIYSANNHPSPIQ
jgi:hypothetical protein